MSANVTVPQTAGEFFNGQRVERNVDGEQGTVTVTDSNGLIIDVRMDNGRPADADLNLWKAVLSPYVGMPVTMCDMPNDTAPGVIVRVNKQSVTVRRVQTKIESYHVSYCQCERCTGTANGSFPIVAQDGVTTAPIGETRRFEKIKSGKYRNLSLGTSVRIVDYRH